MDKIAGMTGPEHHRAGEHALENSETTDLGDRDGMDRALLFAMQAQAHFAAAQSSAYGALVADGDQDGVSQEWATLLGIKADGE